MENNAGQSSPESILKELHAYAKLLYLRSGRQFEERTLYQELERDLSPYETGSDNDSAKNIPLGHLDLDRLRRDFLDRLSETVSSTKGGRYVVASRMFYWPDKVKVFVAINSGFVEGDSQFSFLSNLCAMLKEIAAAPDNQTEKQIDEMWNMLLRHQSSRLSTVIVDLRQIVKTFLQHLLPQNQSPELTDVNFLADTERTMLGFEDSLKLLVKLLFVDGGSDLERHHRLVSVSHAIYRTFSAENFQTLGRGGDKLRQAIGFLGRLQTSFRVLVTAARQVAGFDDLSLIPVMRPKTRNKPPSQEWSLNQTFRALNRQLNDAEASKLMQLSSSKVRWTKNKLLNDFSKLKSPTWEVHAEIQLILFILHNSQDIANGKELEYIGCSRYSCLLCSNFLHLFRGLKTRGCHGKLYNHSWTVPSGDNLRKDEQRALSQAMVKLTSWMRKELLNIDKSFAPKKLLVKESTIGSSSIAIPGISQESHQQSYTISEYIRRQRAETSHMQSEQNRRLVLVDDKEASSSQARDETPVGGSVNLCTCCFEIETSRQCSYCGAAPFCGETCEREMPLSHLLRCNMRQATSADYLYEDILVDEMPTDPQVRHDYWFDRCQNSNEESHLSGVFAGLLKYHPGRITREKLNLWRSHPGGNIYLVTEIVRKFEELPKNSMGSYFPWFKRHRTRFELPDAHPLIPRALCAERQVEEGQAKARKYLLSEDQQKAFQDLAPFAKRHCFAFYAMTINNGYPAPINREPCHWFDFGFVVCNDQHEEKMLGSIYNRILFGSKSSGDYARSIGCPKLMEMGKKEGPICSFDEFWRAWEKGKLMTIFNKYLSTRNSFLPAQDSPTRLEVFLACEGEAPKLPIWRLRHFLALEGASLESATCVIAQGARDYGFSEKLDTRTTMELRDFYAQLFETVAPWTIHQERTKGNLLPFARAHINVVTPRVEAVLQGLL